MRIFFQLNQLQTLFLGSMLFFILFLSVEIIYRSSGRVSLLSRAASSESVSENLQVHLQNFHRIELKNGKRMWEVNAKEAKHYDNDGISHVNDSELIIYRSNLAPINLHSNAAKLFLLQDEINKAELEGEVDLKIEGELQVNSGRATYDLYKQEINSIEEVFISGVGYQVSAVGFKLNVNTGNIELLSNVKSKFYGGAKWPRELTDNNKS